jgi:hypothetical protein
MAFEPARFDSEQVMVARLDVSVFVLGLSFALVACGGAQTPHGTGGGESGNNGNGNNNGGSEPGSGGGGNATSNGSSGGPALPQEVPPRAPPGSCGMDHPAFCEDFETPDPGGRSGDLDEKRWSFARWGHETRMHFVRVPASTDPKSVQPAVFCGKPFSGLLPGTDIATCDGTGVDGLTSRQLNEVYDDQGDFAINSNRIRQLFDVDAKVNPCNLGHGWWVELWITAEPAPIPYHEAPGVIAYPKNGLAIMFQGLNNCPQGRSATEVNGVFVSKDFKILHDPPGWELQHDSDSARCFKTADQKMNRIKVLLNKDQAEIWASDYDDAMNMHRIAIAPNLDLPFTRGYIHLQHSQYNARKDLCQDGGEPTGIQTYRWDNVAFDGPSYATPRGYAVDDNTEPDIDGAGGHMYGWRITDQDWLKLKVKGVDLTDAKSASIDYSLLLPAGRILQYRVNGGPTHQFTIPALLGSVDNAREGLRAFSADIPVSELVAGENTLEFMSSSPQADKEEMVGNVELTVQ